MFGKSVFAVAMFFAAISLARAETFTFTAIPDEDQSRLRQRFDKVAAYLSKQLSVNVRYVPVKSYSAAISAFRNNQVQLAWFGGLSGVRARSLVEGSQAIAQGWEDQSFVTYFIAHASAGIASNKIFPKSIAGKTFTFGSKGSTSGRLMPEFYIRRYFEASPNKIFSRVGFSGDHSRTIALVQSGAYQIGAVNFKVWDNERKAGNIDKTKVWIIWKTPTYPDYQWSIRGDVAKKWGVGFTDKVKQALLGLKDPALLAAFPRKRFISASNADYDPIRRTGLAIGILD